ncbi:ArsR/SmtB family transcription factor [Paenibacillus daejeonensis]|uniref:ArsR/SmtB family transcription factor n=1 Tax=Paenibacillus daejeonensis TaxID=135193 RepID=UPI000360C18E|nr:metalloregulator ArsR/SmtB family transcription factor [Paenibacillus daejeonensis]
METTTFSALSEPNRLRIVELLLLGPLTVGEIAKRLDIRQPQASKHLKVLLESGLVEVEAIANRREYRLRPEPFRQLTTWLASYRDLWEERFDNLDIYLKRLQDQSNDRTSEPTPEES